MPGAFEKLEPASESAVREAAERLLPGDLVAWLEISNGFAELGTFGNLIPVLHNPIPFQGMLSSRDQLRRSYADWPKPGSDLPAGSSSREWLDEFLPIADSGTDVWLFVDLRPGELFGCVGQFESEDGCASPRWSSVAAMLADVAEALTDGRPALRDFANREAERGVRVTATWSPTVQNGRLRWQPDIQRT